MARVLPLSCCFVVLVGCSADPEVALLEAKVDARLLALEQAPDAGSPDEVAAWLTALEGAGVLGLGDAGVTVEANRLKDFVNYTLSVPRSDGARGISAAREALQRFPELRVGELTARDDQLTVTLIGFTPSPPSGLEPMTPHEPPLFCSQECKALHRRLAEKQTKLEALLRRETAFDRSQREALVHGRELQRGFAGADVVPYLERLASAAWFKPVEQLTLTFSAQRVPPHAIRQGTAALAAPCDETFKGLATCEWSASREELELTPLVLPSADAGVTPAPP